jgi:hypothetical protein
VSFLLRDHANLLCNVKRLFDARSEDRAESRRENLIYKAINDRAFLSRVWSFSTVKHDLNMTHRIGVLGCRWMICNVTVLLVPVEQRAPNDVGRWQCTVLVVLCQMVSPFVATASCLGPT